jgi:nucleoside-diphosphate-sugar epimerase
LNIFLTGATGFVGKKLANELLADGHTIYVLCRNKKKAESFVREMPASFRERVSCLIGDLNKEMLGFSEKELDSLNEQVDAIYHMAAYLSFDPSEKEETFKVNLEGTIHILELADNIQCKKFMYVSTAYTVGMETEGKEELYNLDRDFVNHYEESKAHAEHLVSSFESEMDIIILRPSIIIGDSKTGEADTTFGVYGLLKAASLLKRKASKDKEYEAVTFRFLGEADLKMNLVPVDYVTKVLKAALKFGENERIYNITDPEPLPQKEIFKAVKEVLEFPNLELVPFSEEYTLKPIEKTFNNSMSIFKHYFKREIQFSCRNTQLLLIKADLQPLEMDYPKLKFILSGFTS